MEKIQPCLVLGLNEDDEDTLSLSDVLLYYDQSVEYQVEEPSVSDNDEQDFEFSSEMMITSPNSLNPVVFCGKLIRISPHDMRKIESKKQGRVMHHEMSVERKASSIMVATKKSRWYFFMFGFGSSRFHKDLHIRDLRRRHTFESSKYYYYNNNDKCDHDHDRSMVKSRRLIRFLGCLGGINDSENEGGDSCSKFHCQS